jgi:hypothetical protein
MEAKEAALAQFQELVSTYQSQLQQAKLKHDKELEQSNAEKVKALDPGNGYAASRRAGETGFGKERWDHSANES